VHGNDHFPVDFYRRAGEIHAGRNDATICQEEFFHTSMMKQRIPFAQFSKSA
jgi:hypothetical protein